MMDPAMKVASYQIRLDTNYDPIIAEVDGEPCIEFRLVETEALARRFDAIRSAKGYIPMIPATTESNFDQCGRYIIRAAFTKTRNGIRLELWGEVFGSLSDDDGAMYQLMTPNIEDEKMLISLISQQYEQAYSAPFDKLFEDNFVTNGNNLTI